MKKLLLLLALAFCLNGWAQIITTVAGNGTGAYAGDGGQAINAKLYYPQGVAFDAAGNMYIADYSNHRIRKVTTAGIITTIAGNGMAGYAGDMGQATAAELNYPIAVAFDAAGNLYISDKSNQRIRKVNTAGMISTFAGGGTSGLGDGGAATDAQLSFPWGITLDATGNLYIADYYIHCVRKVTTSGIITTIAGTGVGNYSGDGGAASAAELHYPMGVALDAANNLYIADEGNNLIRKINTLGIISTIAGDTTGLISGGANIGFSGDGGNATAAKLGDPEEVTLDAAGNLYIVDSDNNRIRKVNAAGIITTIAGSGPLYPNGGFSGDGGQATAAGLYGPSGIAIDAAGNIYIADKLNHRIRMLVNCSISPTVTYTLINVSPHYYDAVPVYSSNVSSARWYWGDSTSTIGLYPSHTYTTANTYSICVAAYSSCGDSVVYCQNDAVYRLGNNSTYSNMVYVNVLNNNITTDINQIANNNNQISIYPNPNNGSFIVETNSSEKQSLQLYDVNGRMVLSQAIQPTPNPSREVNSTTINASSLQNGIYNLSIISHTGIVNKRIVITH